MKKYQLLIVIFIFAFGLHYPQSRLLKSDIIYNVTVSKSLGPQTSDDTIEDTTQIATSDVPKIEALPVIMYDTDVGFGYGAKAFFLNQLKTYESIDLILFNSTKGERWYRFVFSIPDFELRQQKVYPVSFDLTIDYDKMIKNNFFGVGANSKYDDREYYTKESLDISLNVGRGFTKSIVGQFGLRYKSIKSYNYDPNGQLTKMPTSFKSDYVYYASAFVTLRYDTRNSFINPSKGFYASCDAEFANLNVKSNVNFIRWSSVVQYFSTLLHPSTVIALRLITNNMIGDNLPLQILLPVGGTNTLRGSPIDRYLDKSTILANAELRFPIVWRLGGLVALDAGKVFSSLNRAAFNDSEVNPTFGLRLYMDTFIVRIDVGLGRETTGFYFNFGHLF